MSSSNPIPIQTNLVFRPAPSDQQNGSPKTVQYSKHKHSRSSYSEGSPLTAVSRNNSLSFRPLKRSTPSPNKTIAVINASGRQAASLIRIATAVGYKVRAQLRNLEGVIATEVATNPNVTVLVGELYIRNKPDDKQDVTAHGDLPGILVNHSLINELFRGAQLAFINTTFYGNELHIGQAIADAAKKVGVQHYVYSSMPDHAKYDAAWPSLPLWAAKHEVEEYVRKIGLPATFVYTGIYNNNFTSLLYPLFCMELKPDGSFEWQAPFHPDAKLPWLDAEHDVGPAIIQLFKDGPPKLAKLLRGGVGRPVRYKRGPIEVKVKIPEGYREQLEALEKLFCLSNNDPKKQPPYFGDRKLDDRCPDDALALWEGPRGLEEYAREIFPMEEEANGMTWMFGDEVGFTSEPVSSPVALHEGNGDGAVNDEGDRDEESFDEGLVMRGLKRDEEDWLA
ncbi:hypothetical protein O1611_g3552 [Lasiodiplodia mahajangana]|uniref:Uncharacterized protein n=1 Tax=Lasiodiplodia mahajangana TaxID=1108764 RepID=A0ACC2JRH5_9PEZI|nr:hypothetical protein O1611_g3552 [Lasiodiplodia mahajangana]